MVRIRWLHSSAKLANCYTRSIMAASRPSKRWLPKKEAIIQKTEIFLSGSRLHPHLSKPSNFWALVLQDRPLLFCSLELLKPGMGTSAKICREQQQLWHPSHLYSLDTKEIERLYRVLSHTNNRSHQQLGRAGILRLCRTGQIQK